MTSHSIFLHPFLISVFNAFPSPSMLCFAAAVSTAASAANRANFQLFRQEDQNSARGRDEGFR